MKNNNFERYLRCIIDDSSLNGLIPEILESFIDLRLKKNSLIVKEGENCNYFCYIESGVLQHSINIDGDEKTTYLALKNSCTTALKSFLNATPSNKNIKALSKCHLKVIEINVFNKLMDTNKAFYTFYHNLIKNQIFLIDDYRVDLLTLTPEERYKKLLISEPELLNTIPLHYLAAFLGISKRHMSRIRKNIN